MSESIKLTGKDLREKAVNLLSGNPSLTRKELAIACGYPGTKTGIQEFSEAYIVASGLLPADPVTKQPQEKDIFQINKTGMACVRKSWLAKINVLPADRVKFFYNQVEDRIEISKVTGDVSEVRTTPVAVEAVTDDTSSDVEYIPQSIPIEVAATAESIPAEPEADRFSDVVCPGGVATVSTESAIKYNLTDDLQINSGTSNSLGAE